MSSSKTKNNKGSTMEEQNETQIGSEIEEVVILKYKLNLYTSNGLLKPEIPRAVFTQMSTRYGDIIRSISGYQWMTFNDIVNSYQNLAKRLRFEPIRNPNQIQEAIEELIEASMLLVK